MESKKVVKLSSFKAKVMRSTTHFLQKVVSRRLTIKDGFNTRFRSFITIFIPKLTPKYYKPNLMWHIGNGGGSVMIRFKHPDDLKKVCQDVLDTLNSEKWLDAWWRIENISSGLVQNNTLTMDEDLIDINEWKEELDGIEITATESPSD
jgi:hypothetical protein